jgi:hypothetical protein
VCARTEYLHSDRHCRTSRLCLSPQFGSGQNQLRKGLPRRSGALSCSILQQYYGDKTVEPNLGLVEELAQFMVPQCDHGVARACGFIAVADFGLGKDAEGSKALKQACELGDYWACWIGKTYGR